MEKVDKNVHKMDFPIKINKKKAQTQKLIKISGIDIYFPYEPYPPQKTYMEKVISSLNNCGGISGLESPTGSGKTLCLLCAIFAWVEHYNKKISIYYCTRTVSQINNLLKELNKTCYILNTSFITSKKYTCLYFSKQEKKDKTHSQLNDICDYLKKNLFSKNKPKETDDENDKNKKEQTLPEEKEICEYYKTKDSYHNYYENNSIEDIEDLLKKGKEEKFCPYFYNIFKTEKCATFTIMTYNYMLNPYIRKKLNVVAQNSIIILDEAHNICNNFENLYSKKISINDLENIQMLLSVLTLSVNERKREYPYLKEIEPILKIDKIDIDKEVKAVESLIDEIKNLNEEGMNPFKKFENLNKNIYYVNAKFLIEKFKNLNKKFYVIVKKRYNILDDKNKNNLNDFYSRNKQPKNKNQFKNLIDTSNKLLEFLNDLEAFKNINESKSNSLPAAPIISKKEKNIENKFEKDLETNNIDETKDEDDNIKKRKFKESEINSFRFIVELDENKKLFEIICLDASIGLKEYLTLNPYSTILTSGTLAIDSIKNLFIKNNENKNFIELNNEHVIDNNQFKINIITGYKSGINNYDYSFTMKNRKNENQVMSLGKEIYNLIKTVKVGGVLVFFQSFEFLQFCYNRWLESGIIQQFELIKKVFFDLSFNRAYSEETIMEYKQNNNLLLLTVYRGRNSEGINFPDDEARMVICVGVPYANLSDMRVQLKKNFLDEKSKKEKNNYDGKKWYREEALNAVNQSLGRLLRNKNDFGIMICFGIEFSYNIHYLTKWIRNNSIKVVRLKENDETYYNHLTKFLNNLRQKLNFTKSNYNEKFDIDDFIEENIDEFYEDNIDNDDYPESKYDFYNKEKFKDYSINNEINYSGNAPPVLGFKRYREKEIEKENKKEKRKYNKDYDDNDDIF